jgi:phosphoribosylaminoimidazole-succinocarboxamide synthase
MGEQVLRETDLPGIKQLGRGKVRDLYDLGDKLLIVATDRISAFDVVLPDGIPDKGRVLTGLTLLWLGLTKGLVENHLLSAEAADFPEPLQAHAPLLAGRSMLVKKARVVPVECVVRGYLAGSGWKEYRARGTVCERPLPPGLEESAELPEPIFTPATKAASGHDENISLEQAGEMIGKEALDTIAQKSLALYRKAAEYARGRGVIIADTKFEFGYHGDRIILIDEVLTPDSSRFWDAVRYQPGRSQDSFDKQFVRDYLEKIRWNKKPPAPRLPADVIARTRQKYLEAYRRLVGRELGTA